MTSYFLINIFASETDFQNMSLIVALLVLFPTTRILVMGLKFLTTLILLFYKLVLLFLVLKF